MWSFGQCLDVRALALSPGRMRVVDPGPYIAALMLWIYVPVVDFRLIAVLYLKCENVPI